MEIKNSVDHYEISPRFKACMEDLGITKKELKL